MKKKIALVLSKIFITYYKIRYKSRVVFGKNIIINYRFKVKGQGKLIIGDNSNLWAHKEANEFFFYSKKAVVRIGKNSRLNGITCHCMESIKLGRHCLSGSAIIMDTDFHVVKNPEHILFGNPQSKAVKIGNQVWLGGQSAILKGLRIGSKSVVGFRAVVTKSFPSNVVIAGNPAKIVKRKNN
jgi:acetyltransferase-like isoleucine patch superfamily enzyme